MSTPVSYCDVRGFVSTTKLGPDQVNFELSLPGAFNGRYILNAQGGSAGFVPPPPASQLSAGYAIVGTDEGNQSGGLDYRFAVNRAAALDWDYLGVHVVTVSTEQLTSAYYSHRQIYTYIAGCSGGGRSAVDEASLYPHDYDGVVAGAPGINPNNILFFGQLTQFLLRHPDGWRLSPVYDVVPVPAISLERRDLALTVGSYGRAASLYNLAFLYRERGHFEEAEALLDEARKVVRANLEEAVVAGATDIESIRRHARSSLGKFVQERTRRRPMIVPVVMEV